jgi:prepilin-type N-terminal cleavage/methylation domain-containing protein
MNQRRNRLTGAAGMKYRAGRSGFTLIECMIAMFLIAIVLPAVELSFAAVTKSAEQAHRRTEAAGLAQSEMSSLIASENWQSATTLKGDFGPDWPGYTWQADISVWTGGTNQTTTGSSTVTMEQLDVTVSWGPATPTAVNSVTVSSLVYQRPGSTTSN